MNYNRQPLFTCGALGIRKILTLLLMTMMTFNVKSSMAQSKLLPGEHYANINGIKLHYYVSGQGPVCLLPTAGWGIPIEYIRPLPVFEKHFTMVYFDTRLSGKSTGPEDPKKYGADDYMQDMDSLRVFLGQPKVWIAGHSMGGYQVLNYAINHNDKLNGLIVMAGIVEIDSVRQKQYGKLILKRKNDPYYLAHPGYYTKGAAILLGKDTGHYNLKQSFDLTGGFYCHDGAKGVKFFKDIVFNDAVDKNISASGFFKRRLLPDLNKITVPTFVLAGDDDFICDYISQSTRIHTRIPNSQLIILKDCGHMLWAEQPAAFNLVCENWFRSQGL